MYSVASFRFCLCNNKSMFNIGSMEQYISAIVTFIVGFVALFVYLKQKRDHKKDAANILLIEIEAAERQLQIVKESGAPQELKEGSFLMPSSSWSTYRHLFARDLSPREWDIITNFYTKCKQFDESVDYNSSFFKQDVEAYRLSINSALALIAKDVSINIDEGPSQDESLIFDAANEHYRRIAGRAKNLFMNVENIYRYEPNKPISDAIDALATLDTGISTGTIGIKLRRIAKPGFATRFFKKTI